MNNPYDSYSNQSFFDGAKSSFRQGSVLTKLIYINLAVFMVINIIAVFYFLFDIDPEGGFSVVYWLSVPADTEALSERPWTVLTYMFLHKDFLHILFNMLWLYWFGKIFLLYLDQKKLLSIYLIGGLTGSAFYIFSYNLFPVFEDARMLSTALGASASVIAIVLAVAVYVPNHIINMMFIGGVKVKHIAIFFIILDVLSIASSNSGGHIAHLGGAFYGWLYISRLRKGKDIAAGFNQFLDWLMRLFKKEEKIRVSYRSKIRTNDREYNRQKKQKQEVLNKILDKISKSGYDSLTKEEKEILFKSSNNKVN